MSAKCPRCGGVANVEMYLHLETITCPSCGWSQQSTIYPKAVTVTNVTIQLVMHPIRMFLAHQLAPADLVRIVDDLVAQGRMMGLEARAAELLEELHDSLALYVPGEASRREHASYIGEGELRQRAAQFIAALGTSTRDDKDV